MARRREKSGHRDNGAGSKETPGFSFDRRDFLKVLGLSVSAAASGCEVVGVPGVGESGQALTDSDLPIDYSLQAVRKDDFVVLRFDFVNFAPHPDRRVLRRKQSGPAYIVVNFPSQHLFEEAFVETSARQSKEP